MPARHRDEENEYRGWGRSDDEGEVEAHSVRVKIGDQDGEEFDVEAHFRSWRSDDEAKPGDPEYRSWRNDEEAGEEEADVEGHGPVMGFTFTFTDPEAIATLNRVSGLEGPGKADLSERDVTITFLDESGKEVIARANRFNGRDEEAEVEAHWKGW